MKRLEQIESDFESALKSLEGAVLEATSDLEIDGAIQRFEFTYELFWKFLKAYLQRQGGEGHHPLATQEASQSLLAWRRSYL